MGRTTRPVAGAVGILAMALFVASLIAAPAYSPWSEAVNLGSLVNAANLDDGCPVLSKDGRSLYFSSSNRPGGVGRYDIWVARWDDSIMAWGAPVNLGPNVNSTMGDFTPALSRDEHWLFFASNRPGSIGQRDLYASYRQQTGDDLGWEPAVNLGPGVNTAADEFGVTFFENEEAGVGQLYFGSTRAGSGNFDIYVTEVDGSGQFGPPQPVPGLDSGAQEMTPAMRHDGLELFFASDRPEGSGGIDIWAVTRQTVSDAWSEPVNAGPGVNSPRWELYPAISGDRAMLLFMRADQSVPTSGEIWMSTRSKLHDR